MPFTLSPDQLHKIALAALAAPVAAYILRALAGVVLAWRDARREP